MTPQPPSGGLFEQAAIAAYATMRPHERQRFDATLGPAAGQAAAATYLSAAVKDDRWADRIHPWWNAHADDITEALAFLTGVTHDEARALLTTVTYLTAAQGDDLAVQAILRHTERSAAYVHGRRGSGGLGGE
jgi:hypothetical protein